MTGSAAALALVAAAVAGRERHMGYLLSGPYLSRGIGPGFTSRLPGKFACVIVLFHIRIRAEWVVWELLYVSMNGSGCTPQGQT